MLAGKSQPQTGQTISKASYYEQCHGSAVLPRNRLDDIFISRQGLIFRLNLPARTATYIDAGKIIGKKKDLSPAERVHAHARLIESMNLLRPYPRVTGKILRFKTWRDLDEFNRTRASNRT